MKMPGRPLTWRRRSLAMVCAVRVRAAWLARYRCPRTRSPVIPKISASIRYSAPSRNTFILSR
jgi:hypothetical protein